MPIVPLSLTRRVLTLAATLAVLATALGGPASASGTGHYGPHYLRDNDEFGGARCVYPEPWTALDRIRIRPPSVYAYDRTAQNDVQTVGWRVVLEASTDRLTWGVAAPGPIAKATATESIDAAFTPVTIYLPAGPVTEYFRIRIKMYWYYPNATTIDGRADHLVTFYEIVAVNWGSAVRMQPCKGDTPILQGGLPDAHPRGKGRS